MWCGVAEETRWFYLVYCRTYGISSFGLRLQRSCPLGYLQGFGEWKGFADRCCCEIFQSTLYHRGSGFFFKAFSWSVRPASCFHNRAELPGGAVAVLSV